MKAEEIFEMLKDVGVELKSRSLLGFESYERVQTLKEAKCWVTVFESVRCREGIWTCYYAGFVTDENGNVFAVFASRHYRDDEWNYTSSTTYVAALTELKAKMFERAGHSARVGSPPHEYVTWREEVDEREVVIPALPREMKKLVEDMRSSTYAKYVWIDGQWREIKWPEL
jgi:hypothetical protein